MCASIYMYGKLRILLDKEDSKGYIRGLCCELGVRVCMHGEISWRVEVRRSRIVIR